MTMELFEDRYQIIRTLGKGGLGIAYLAEDLDLHKRVVIKLFSDELMGDRRSRDNFMKEVEIVSRLDHPNIVDVIEIKEEGSSCYIVSDFVEGKNLRQRLEEGNVGIVEAVKVATQVAQALDYLHQSGIIHRDLRPENILLDHNGTVKITDFGMAKILQPSAITIPGVVLGNVNYLSPEQIMGQTIDPRTDLWSLGVMLYEMTVHQPPFAGDSPGATAKAILKNKPALRRMRDSELKGIVSKALEKSKDRRYQSAGAMVSDLEELQGSHRAPNVSGVFARLWSRLTATGTSQTRRAPQTKTSGDSPSELYINLWVEDEAEVPVDLSRELSAGSTYTFLFAIENFSREDHGTATEFVEPDELSKQAKTPVVIELLCPFLETDDDSGYVRREVDYFAGHGFPAEKFTLKPKEEGHFYLTARLLIKGETIYREVLTLEVAADRARASEVGAYAAAALE